MKIYLKKASLLTIIALCIQVIQAQDGAASYSKFRYQVGGVAMLSRVEGDAPGYLRQNASDLSTNFGTKASYTRRWTPSLGIGASGEYRIVQYFGLEFGGEVKRYATKELYEVRYDPPQGGSILSRTAEVKNRYYYASPLLGLRGSWKMLSLSGGIQANLFFWGQTKNEYGGVLVSGPAEIKTYEARLDIQDQPIYRDSEQFGGVADYTHLSPRNHGASPTWLALYGRLDWRLLNKPGSPVLGFAYHFPLQEIHRSQNPKYSLISSYQPDLTEIHLGTKISTLSLHLGWAF